VLTPPAGAVEGGHGRRDVSPPEGPGEGMPHLGLRAPGATALQRRRLEARRPRCEPSRLRPSSEQWTARWMLARHRLRHRLTGRGHRRQRDR
jgi:hypothetical protein